MRQCKYRRRRRGSGGVREEGKQKDSVHPIMIMFRTKRKEELQILEHSTQFPPRKKTIQSKVPASQYAVMNGSRTQECASTLSHLPRSQADSALCSLA